jgi:hypothetical protein
VNDQVRPTLETASPAYMLCRRSTRDRTTATSVLQDDVKIAISFHFKGNHAPRQRVPAILGSDSLRLAG